MAFGAAYNPPANPAFIPYVAPYSFNNPMPGNVNLDPVTGEISYNSNISALTFQQLLRLMHINVGKGLRLFIEKYRLY